MRCVKSLSLDAVFLGLVFAGAVQAGPQVKITFKNNAAMGAVYDIAGSSAYSYAEAVPKPMLNIRAGETNSYSVKGGLSADVTSAVFQYRMGNKVCKFKTSYVKLPGRSGGVPRWNKSAEPGGGARCDIRITSTDVRTHDWSVDFIMR